MWFKVQLGFRVMILREAHTPKKLEHQKNQSSNIKNNQNT
jgi:hypothetical protein